MYLSTHFMLPVIVARQRNLYYAKRKLNEPFLTKHILIIGLAGILPDLLSPHLWISERHTTYSHSLLALIIFSIITVLLIRKNKALILLLISAYALHLLADYISGGIPLLLPFNTEIFYQIWLLPPIDWIIADIILLLVIYFQSWFRRFKTPNN